VRWLVGIVAAGALTIGLPVAADATAQTKHCPHVRGYDNGTVTARGTTCPRAAQILWDWRTHPLRQHFEGWTCHARSAYPGGGFPVWVTCTKAGKRVRGSEFDGGA
jgi:hypothetical protein